MLTDIATELSVFIQKSQIYLVPWGYALGILWAINIINWLTGSKLNILGIYPRHLFGLPGIIFSPLLHYDFNHLFFNSIPLFVLGLVILTRDVQTFYWVTTVIVLLGGFAVWLFGRKAIHIGASGLISGYFGYIIATAYLQPGIISVLLAGLVIYYFGSIFLGVFPQEEQVSWESHLLGFLSGIAAAFLKPQMVETLLMHFK